MRPFHKGESEVYITVQKTSSSCEILVFPHMLSSLHGLLCHSVYRFTAALNTIRVPRRSRDSTTRNLFVDMKPFQVPDGVLELFLWRWLEWEQTTSMPHSPNFSILFKLNGDHHHNTPIAFSRNREGNREENPSPSPKGTTVHQAGLLPVDISQGHIMGVLLIICLLADVLQSLLGKSR